MNERKKKRNREQIVASILHTAKDGATKSKIMNISYLNFTQAKKYLNYAVENRLVHRDQSHAQFFTTNKGLEFLLRFEEVYNIENTMYEKRRMLLGVLDNIAY